MPLHAVCSFVRPASFLYGGMQAYGGSNAIAFPQYVRRPVSYRAC